MTGGRASRKAQLAVPLCLPNNYKWNKQTGECIKIGEERSSLYVVKEALNQLNSIKGKRPWSFLIREIWQKAKLSHHNCNYEKNEDGS